MEVATIAAGRTPPRTHEQRMDALRKGNRIRSHRARLKPDLKAGRRSIAELFDDPDCATMKLYDALVHLPKVGRVKANRIVRLCGISPSKTIGGLTERQRSELVMALP